MTLSTKKSPPKCIINTKLKKNQHIQRPLQSNLVTGRQDIPNAPMGQVTTTDRAHPQYALTHKHIIKPNNTPPQKASSIPWKGAIMDGER